MAPRGRKRTRAAVEHSVSHTSTVLTDMIMLHDPNGSHPTLAALAALREEDSLCDIEIHVSGAPDKPAARTFRAHRNVLAATSDYFRALLLGERFADSTGPKLAISEMSPSCFEAALDFMYSGVAQVSESHLVRMLGVAARLQVMALQAAVEHELIERLSPENVWTTLTLSDQHELAKLRAAALFTAAEQFTAASRSADFVTVPQARLEQLLADDKLQVEKEEEVFDAIIRWLRAQPGGAVNDEKTTVALLQHARFPCMKYEYIQSHVQQEPLMQSAAAMKVLTQAMLEKSYSITSPRTRSRLGLIPKGVQLSLPNSFLDGWTLMYDIPYTEGITAAGLRAVPTDAKHIFVGARAPDGTIRLGAVGLREEVLRETEPNQPHEHNEVWWYFCPGSHMYDSFGFSKSSNIRQNAGDIGEEEGEYRLSWHLGSGGWRAGLVEGLQEDSEEADAELWRKLLYYRRG